jgi:hypothetical protein
MIAPTVVLAAPDNPSDLPDDQVFEISDSGQIEGWDRAAYTLRTDDTGASVQVPPPYSIVGQENASFSDGVDDGGNTKELVAEFDGERNPIGVHNYSTSVDITFDSSRANYEIGSQDDIELVAARLTPEDGTGLPVSSTGDAIDLLSDIDKANANASFQIVNDSITANNGEFSEQASFSTPGQWIVFAAVTEDGKNGFETKATGASVDEGNVSVDGEVVIIGMDQLSIQQDTLGVTRPKRVDPGKNISFSLDAGSLSGSSDVTHAVVLYDKSKFEDDAKFDMVVNSSALNSDFDYATDSQLEHNIQKFNGIARVEDGTTLNGNDLSDGKVQQPVTPSSAIDFFATELGVNTPNSDASKNPEISRMDASATVLNGKSSSATVHVDTHANFSEGTYQYIAVSALDDAESQARTQTGTINIKTKTSPPPSSPSRDSDPDDDDDEEETTEETTEETQDTPTVEEVREELDRTGPSRETNTEIVDNDPDTPGVSVTPEGTQTVRQITFQDEGASGTVTVREYDEPPESLSESVTTSLNQQQTENADSDGSDGETQPQTTRRARVVSVSDISPDSESANGPATIEKTVDRDRFENPENAVVFHERGETWAELPTTVEDAGDGEVTVTAETDSFSLFAVAEVTEDSQTNDGTTEESGDGDGTTEESDDGDGTNEESGDGPGTVVIIGVLVVLALIAAVAFAYSRQSS